MRYREDPKALVPVQIDPNTGQWHQQGFPLDPDCTLHFVVVASSDSAAVYPESIKSHPALSVIGKHFSHWYGRTGNGRSVQENWAIHFGS
jgi:hypothetical protein